MKEHRRESFLAIGGLMMAALCIGEACHPEGNLQATPDSTQVMETVAFLQTQAVLPTALRTSEVGITLPTDTQVPSTNAFAPTSTKIPCLDLEYLGDLTVPDGSTYYPLQVFTKTWQIMNIGSCAWTTDFALVFVSGESMEGAVRMNLPNPVNPGDTIDLSVVMSAPSTIGTHDGYWMLQSDNGVDFGFGDDNHLAWKVEIEVIDYSFYSDAIPEPLDTLHFDFAAAICDAEWTSSFNPPSVPCPGYAENQPAWASILLEPLLEGNNQENERSIWFHPDGQRGHWLTGTFPDYQVQPGDHFTAVIGCLNMSPMCDVSMSMEYIENGDTHLVESWQEFNDGTFQSVDVDLSDLVGHTVQFALTVSGNSNASDPDAFWLVPAIISLP